MKNKKLLFFLGFVLIDALAVLVLIWPNLFSKPYAQAAAVAVPIRTVQSTILANGAVQSQNEATLHFQTGGKLTALPVKEGDRVTQGQVVAQLDTYAFQEQLQLAANAYELTKNNANQTQENEQAGVVNGQQRQSLDTTNKNAYNNITESQVIDDAVKRFVDNSILTQNSAQLTVDLANYAIQLATLTSPISGIVTHEDVTTSGVNVTPATSFSVADPNNIVFRANIDESDIDFIAIGAKATINLTDLEGRTITGTVSKIYPEKQTLPDGENIYQVDIQSNDLSSLGKLSQSGSVLIDNKYHTPVALLPSWTVLNHQYVWVLDSNNQAVLKKIVVGDTNENVTEVLSGLKSTDRVITNPKSIISSKYILL